MGGVCVFVRRRVLSLSFVFVIALFLSLSCLYSLFSSLGSCTSKTSFSLFLSRFFLYSNGRFRNGFFEVDDGAQSRKEEQHLFLFFSFFANERIRSHIGLVWFFFFVHIHVCIHTYV